MGTFRKDLIMLLENLVNLWHRFYAQRVALARKGARCSSFLDHKVTRINTASQGCCLEAAQTLYATSIRRTPAFGTIKDFSNPRRSRKTPDLSIILVSRSILETFISKIPLRNGGFRRSVNPSVWGAVRCISYQFLRLLAEFAVLHEIAQAVEELEWRSV